MYIAKYAAETIACSQSFYKGALKKSFRVLFLHIWSEKGVFISTLESRMDGDWQETAKSFDKAQDFCRGRDSEETFWCPMKILVKRDTCRWSANAHF